MQMVYDIAPGEALIVETEIPQARYWSIQMNDLWWQTTDYAHHQSSLNGHQAHVDADGRVRVVIAREDPGVPNWIDPVIPGRGIAQWRWYLADRHPVPSVTKVAVADVRKHLAEDTPTVTPAERRVADRAAQARRARPLRLLTFIGCDAAASRPRAVIPARAGTPGALLDPDFRRGDGSSAATGPYASAANSQPA